MPHREYPRWLFEAERLVTEWSNPLLVPCINDPIFHQWESADRQESHTIFAWSGGEYDESWAKLIYERIGSVINPNRGAWRWQSPFYAEICGKFFRPARRRFVFNAIMVTPSRIPMRLWPQMGRPPILETTYLPPYKPLPEFQGKSITLVGMSLPLTLNMQDVVWVKAPMKGKSRRHLVNTLSRRIFGHSRFMVNRLFQADFHDEEDIAALEESMVPALREPWMRGDTPGRVGMAMIQLLRMDERGETDLVLLETSHASGLLVDLRWSNQPFATIMMQDPYFAAALREALDTRTKLILA